MRVLLKYDLPGEKRRAVGVKLPGIQTSCGIKFSAFEEETSSSLVPWHLLAQFLTNAQFTMNP